MYPQFRKINILFVCKNILITETVCQQVGGEDAIRLVQRWRAISAQWRWRHHPGPRCRRRDISSAQYCEDCIQVAPLVPSPRLSLRSRRRTSRERHKNPIRTAWIHTPLRHWMATVEAVLSHSWFWYTPGRLATALVAFSSVPGLPRGPAVESVAPLARARTGRKSDKARRRQTFFLQSKLEPLSRNQTFQTNVGSPLTLWSGPS